MTESRQPEETLIAMAGIMVTEQSLDATLRQLLELTCAAVPGGDEGGAVLLEALPLTEVAAGLVQRAGVQQPAEKPPA